MKVIIAFLIFFCYQGVGAVGSTLTDAQKDYLFGDYQEAIRKAESLPASDEQLYFLGSAHIKIGEYAKARTYLERLNKQYVRSGFKVQAMLKIADSYFFEQDFLAAGKMYKDIIGRYPNFDNMPRAYLRLIQINAKAGNWQEKNRLIKIFKDKYSRSSDLALVETIEGYGDFFTIQVGAFSEKKNAHVLRAELSKNYKPYIAQDKNENSSLYRVRIGRYRERREVERVRADLEKEGYPARIYP